MNTFLDSPPRRRPRTLAVELVDSLGQQIRSGKLPAGSKLPTEAEVMEHYQVSRTVVREAISRLQAAGMVETRHGIGTFVLGTGDVRGFLITAENMATLRDVICVLELRIGVETEAAALAAQRRTPENLQRIRATLDNLINAVADNRDSVDADYQFHLEIAQAAHNDHFVNLLASLGSTIIPRARLGTENQNPSDRAEYLRRVNNEHESIYQAIVNCDSDAARAAIRTHLSNSRERRIRAQQGKA